MTEKTERPLPKPRRRRRTPESARREILDAAERQLMKKGPDGLRLQSIAADLGISHSSILHHFGSRDGLLDALSLDAFHVLERDLKKALDSPPEDDSASDLFEKIARILGERGHARLLAWQIMSGRELSDSDSARSALGRAGAGGLLDRLAESLHGMRLEHARSQRQRAPDLDQTRSIVASTACALFGEAIAGETMLRSAGLDTDPQARQSLRRQMAEDIERSVFPADENLR
jgi:AcrR family transcriptional regulator